MPCMLHRISLATTVRPPYLITPLLSIQSVRMIAKFSRTIAGNLYPRAFRTITRNLSTTGAIRTRAPQSHLPRTTVTSFSTFNTPLRMSDVDYAAFLDKANQDPNEGFGKPSSKGSEFKAQDEGAELPKAIREVLKQDKVYISDADEPFVGVALDWDEGGKGLPDEVEFAQLIEHPSPENADVQIQDPVDWDANGDYMDIIEAVRKAGKGNDVRVYSVHKGGVKTEYWVVTTEAGGKENGKGARLVGVKALAVES